MLDIDNVCLRGSIMRNTPEILGIAIYTGHDTRICKNNEGAEYKMSRLMKSTNRKILMIFILQICISFVLGVFGAIWTEKSSGYEYLALEHKSLAYLIVTKMGTWIIIFTNFVPISLLVTLDFAKLF